MNPRVIVTPAVLLAALTLGACGGSGTPVPAPTVTVTVNAPAPSMNVSAEPEPMQESTPSNEFSVTIDGFRMSKSDDKKENVLVIAYTFTNNSTTGAKADEELWVHAYQDGVELESSGFFRADGEEDGWTPIKPGRSITTASAFYLYDEKADVTVEVEASSVVLATRVLSLK